MSIPDIKEKIRKLEEHYLKLGYEINLSDLDRLDKMSKEELKKLEKSLLENEMFTAQKNPSLEN